MKEIELVIKIDEERYSYVKNQVEKGIDNPLKVIIANGTPLPKGHGRLIDADLIAKQYGLDDATKYGNKNAKQQDFSYSTMMMYEIADMIDNAETIIEADKESEDRNDSIYIDHAK